jgi:hypothetical protein
VENVSLQGNTFDVPPSYGYIGACGLFLINGGRYSLAANNTINLRDPLTTGILMSGPVDGGALGPSIGSAEWLLTSNQIQAANGYLGTATGINLAPTGSPWGGTAAHNVNLTGNSVSLAFNNIVPASAGYMSGNTGANFPSQPNLGWQFPMTSWLEFPPT